MKCAANMIFAFTHVDEENIHNKGYLYVTSSNVPCIYEQMNE